MTLRRLEAMPVIDLSSFWHNIDAILRDPPTTHAPPLARYAPRESSP